MSLENRRRRQLLFALTAAFGTDAAAAFVSREQIIGAALAYVPKPISGDGQVFTHVELTLLRAIVEQIIPATDTPGAAEVGVHGFVDHQLAHCHSEAEQTGVRDLLGKIAAAAPAPFPELASAEQVKLLEDVEAARGAFDGPDRDQFKALKTLVVLGYCSSEVGATQVLAFVPYPGRFEGSIPYASVGKAWFE